MEGNSLNTANEVENTNTNNQGNNSGNNLIKILIGIIVIIILGLTALTIYKFNVYDKKESDNNITEKEDNISDNKDNVQEDNQNISTGDKVLDEYYLKTTDIVDEHVVAYRYSAIAKGEFSYDYLKKAYVAKNILQNMKPVGYTDYPCCSPEEYMTSFGLSKEEINKMDKNIWPNQLGGGGYFVSYMYDVSIIRDKYPDIYNDVFNSSFSVKLNTSQSSLYSGYIYDKNLDKVVTDGSGGTPETEKRAIIETKEENNLYKVIFVEGVFFPGENGMLEQTIKEEISYEMNEATEFLKRNKDKLNKYEVTFEKISTGYKYKSIIKI